MAKSKRFREALTKIDREKTYGLMEAVDLVRSTATAKFDETVEVHLKLKMRSKDSVRDTFVMPHSFIKEKRILVFARGEKADEARSAGARVVGAEELVEQIRGGWMDFDVAVATPDLMREVGKLGPILGRRGLMPNPKTQTVTNDVAGAIAELKRGRVEFRADKTGVVHMPVGKVSMESQQIIENATVFVAEVRKKRPAEVKGEFVTSAAVSSTMGPGVRVATR
jgi:large subunit ribosomal protein L1